MVLDSLVFLLFLLLKVRIELLKELVLLGLLYLAGLLHFPIVNAVFSDGSLQILASEASFQVHFVVEHGFIEENCLLEIVVLAVHLTSVLHLHDLAVNVFQESFFFVEQLLGDWLG